jgi:hypothetical protein
MRLCAVGTVIASLVFVCCGREDSPLPRPAVATTAQNLALLDQAEVGDIPGILTSLAAGAAPCQCHRRLSLDATTDGAEARPVQFARRATSFEEARVLVRQVDEARWALEVHRSSQPRASSIDFAERLLELIDQPGDPAA